MTLQNLTYMQNLMSLLADTLVERDIYTRIIQTLIYREQVHMPYSYELVQESVLRREGRSAFFWVKFVNADCACADSK